MPEYNNNVNTISTNVDDYTYAELLLLLNLNDINGLNKEAIIESTGKFIKKYTADDRPQLVTFFENIRKKLIQYTEQIEDGETNVGPQAAQTTQWTADAGALPQDDKQQMDKTTDRFQKIDVYGNDAVPMEREKLGVNNTYDVPVVQDGKLNPKLENTVNRMVVIDSFYRQESAGGNISTDFTLDLSDKLTSVLSMRIWSTQIPLTYYNIDDVYGNTCFWITNDGQDVPVSVPPAAVPALALAPKSLMN